MQSPTKDVTQRRARIRRALLRHGLLLLGDLHRLDRQSGLLRLVEAGHHRVELLADVETLRLLLVAIARQVRAPDEAGRAIVADLHFKAAVADFPPRDGDDLVLARARRGPGSGRSATLKPLHPQSTDEARGGNRGGNK